VASKGVNLADSAKEGMPKDAIRELVQPKKRRREKGLVDGSFKIGKKPLRLYKWAMRLKKKNTRENRCS
jgi:hypothetical protein